ncbi:hypothetical protein NECAME_16595 [Necator americanus]|uniref:Uncharacterized protein n=1 Tax=Necator americanus TaxID=51031 RepID=W2TVQ4_NECAM|nr:hypothetical protein NECAME_16595 [Necator americanus]ETN85888.1 hypothetical protein NECAME_16595 [Necator americanus]
MMATPAVVTGPAQLPVGPFPVATHPVPMGPIMPSAPIQAPPALPPQSPQIPSYNVPQMINAMPPPTAEIHPAPPGPAPSDYQMQAYQPKTYLSSAPNAKRLRL